MSERNSTFALSVRIAMLFKGLNIYKKTHEAHFQKGCKAYMKLFLYYITE